MVEATAKLLLNEISDTERQPEKVEIPGELVIRGSARLPLGQQRSLADAEAQD